jgi:hypothetical protein
LAQPTRKTRVGRAARLQVRLAALDVLPAIVEPSVKALLNIDSYRRRRRAQRRWYAKFER